jgi:hypothetical protein
MQQALHALEKIADWHGAYGPFPENNAAWRGMAVVTARESVTALRTALAQSEQEPTCLECKAAVLYECVACSSNNYPPKPEQEPVAIDGNTSDGYHTFNELYEFRKAYNAALFNEWAAGGKCSVHKSWRHHDNELCFGGGWFIVVAVLPQGQISNHYEAKDWDLFAVPEVERALFEFDGHTGADVVERLKTYTTPPAQLEQVDCPRCGHVCSQRPWVGLTEEDVKHEWEVWRASLPRYIGFAQGIEAKLKERNNG